MYNFGKGSSVLPGFTTGSISLSDTGTLSISGSGALVKDLSLSNKNLFTVTNQAGDKLKLTVAPTTGVFKGSFIYPGQKKKATTFSGVLFQDQLEGAGYFLGPDGGGSVSLFAR